MIKAILFDLDDTLLWDEKSVKEAFRAACAIGAEKYDIDPEQLETAVRKNARALYASYDIYEFTQMIGINPFEGLWGNFVDKGEWFQKLHEIAPTYRKNAWIRGLKELGINDPEFGEVLAEAFPCERHKNAFVFEDTYKVLDQLKEKYQLLMLTNGSPDLQNTKLDLTPELRAYFDHIVISGSFGKGKPDPAIFEHAIGLLSVQKEEALMVGDNLNTDILGASRAGIQSVWVNWKDKEKNDVHPTYEISRLRELLPILETVQVR